LVVAGGWAGMAGSNGPARGHANGPKGGNKASTQQDVENYFKINEVQRLVLDAVNSVAQERPDDFKTGLSAAIVAHSNTGLAPEVAKKSHTKEDAEEAKKYLEKNDAEAILSEILGKLAVAMPPNAANALAEYAATATGAGAYVAPKAEKKEETAENKGKDDKKEKDEEKADEAEPAAAAAAPASAAAEPAAPAPAAAAPQKEESKSNLDPKKLKACLKEGGKMGVELIGNFDLGGPEFFTTKAEAPEGDHELLQALMDAANKEIDPTEEEAKGGSAFVGKMFLAAGDTRLALLCHCPKGEHSAENKAAGKCDASEWMKGTLAKIPDGKGVFLEGNAFFAKGEIVTDTTAGRFPLKDRDECQSASVGWLKEKNLFPEAEEEDDWQPDDDAGIEW